MSVCAQIFMFTFISSRELAKASTVFTGGRRMRLPRKAPAPGFSPVQEWPEILQENVPYERVEWPTVDWRSLSQRPQVTVPPLE